MIDPGPDPGGAPDPVPFPTQQASGTTIHAPASPPTILHLCLGSTRSAEAETTFVVKPRSPIETDRVRLVLPVAEPGLPPAEPPEAPPALDDSTDSPPQTDSGGDRRRPVKRMALGLAVTAAITIAAAVIIVVFTGGSNDLERRAPDAEAAISTSEQAAVGAESAGQALADESPELAAETPAETGPADTVATTAAPSPEATTVAPEAEPDLEASVDGSTTAGQLQAETPGESVSTSEAVPPTDEVSGATSGSDASASAAEAADVDIAQESPYAEAIGIALDAYPLTDDNFILSATDIERLRVWPDIVTWTVQDNDRIRAIADQYDTAVPAVAAINRVTKPDVIQPGQVLLVPRGFHPEYRDGSGAR